MSYFRFNQHQQSPKQNIILIRLCFESGNPEILSGMKLNSESSSERIRLRKKVIAKKPRNPLWFPKKKRKNRNSGFLWFFGYHFFNKKKW